MAYRPDHFGSIATFITAARAASFTEAGERLGISKSAVGKSIAKLEARLGVQLFHRSTRKRALTADGEAYLAACTQALEEIENVENAFASHQRGPAGRLRIDVPASFGRHVVMPVLTRLAHAFPELHLTVSFNDCLIDPIEEGVDLVVRFGELREWPGLVARKLMSQELVICAAPEYLHKHGTPQTLAELAQHRGLVGYRGGLLLSWVIRENDQRVRFTPPATHQIGDGDALLAAALAGLGLCQMPLSEVRDHLLSGALVPVLDALCAGTVDVHVLWPQTAHVRPKVRFVVDELMRLAEQGELLQALDSSATHPPR